MHKTNFHTHTTRCHHAQGLDEEYVLAAIEAGFDTLGFSDHGPFPFGKEYTSRMRMTMSELDDYLASVRSLAQKYQDKIKIFCGLEYEYFPEYLTHCHDLLDSGKIDYMIFGNHLDLDERTGMYFGNCTRPEHILRYVKTSISGMETGLFSYFAHPELFLHAYPAFDTSVKEASRDLCACAKALGTPLEYNLLGLEKQAMGVPGLGYPYIGFWEIAAEQSCTAIIGVDAHRPDALLSPAFEEACVTLDKLGIKYTSQLR